MPEGPGSRTAKSKTANKRIKGQNNSQPKRREGGRQRGGGVWVGVSGPQPSLVTLVSRREVKPTRAKQTTQNRESGKRQNAQRKTKQTQEEAKPNKQGGVVLWCLLQSVFCWSLPPGIWLYLQRPGCPTFGMVCCGWLAPVYIPPHGNKGLGPVWGSALYTMLWVLIRCLSLLHWGICPWVIQNPLRTPIKLHAPVFLACAVSSLLPLLPSRASSLSLFAGLRLPSSPRAPFLPFLVLSASLPA